MIKSPLKFILIILLITLTGCSGRLFTVHKIDVQQGNAVDPEKVEQLQIGMSEEQVKFLMGTALINDSFHPDRWDYVYYLIPDYGDTERRHVAVYFENGKVINIEKSDIPLPQQEQVSDADTEQENSKVAQE
ncbi:MAG: outer membrane protein assembly factor BamE [Gammaproteobacteria bacterium]|nr:outer membrane protein assembly factor BamE [Gammaproteobacteria bacterium]